MKANELRIGNLYRWLHEEHERYEQVDAKFIFTQAEYNENHDWDKFSRGWWVKPIPLTEEWLVKLGGIKPDGLFYWLGDSDNAITIRVKSNGSFWFNASNPAMVIKTKIEHVHQLQNLYFALVGEELVETNKN